VGKYQVGKCQASVQASEPSVLTVQVSQPFVQVLKPLVHVSVYTVLYHRA